MGEERDLFSKIYTYEEVLALQPLEKEKPQPGEKPAHWPEDFEPDPAKSVFWLPDGWGQGLKTLTSGKKLRCFIGPPPEGKRFFHKKQIEKYMGRELKGRELPKKTAPETVHDSVPHWPEESDWLLPKDWRIAWRQLPAGVHRIYVPPGQDEGFLYHRNDVEKYLSGQTTKLSHFGTSKPLGTSKPMPEISAQALVAGTSSKKKRKIMTDVYKECAAFRVLRLPVATQEGVSELKAAGVSDAQALCRDGAEVRELLVSIRCPRDTELLMVTMQEQTAPSEGQLVWQRLQGCYRAMQTTLGGRTVYEKVMKMQASSSGVACGGEYIFWSEGQRRWSIGAVDEATSCLAFCDDDQARVTEVKKPWKLLPDRFLNPRD